MIKTTLPKVLLLIQKHWPVIISALILAVLLFRNPYSQRNLIANFEPFPDSFHYIVPPKCWLNGQGWKLCRDGFEGIKPVVPPLYSITLLPVFSVLPDPRSFYFLNVLLSFLSLFFLYATIRRISSRKMIAFVVCFIFVTSYQVYWLPTLAMAENLFLPFFLATTWLVAHKKFLLWHLAGISLLAGLLYGTKFVGLPLLVGFLSTTGLRVLMEKNSWKILAEKTAALTIPALVLFLAFGGWATINDVVDISHLLTFASKTETQEIVAATSSAEVVSTSSGDWFELAYFSKNFQTYAGILLGKPTQFLWDNTPLLPKWLVLPAWIGLLYGLFRKKWRWLSISLIVVVFVQLVLLSFFYTTDARYVYTILPTGMIGLTLFFKLLYRVQKRVKTIPKATIFFLLLALLTAYSAGNFARLKLQVALNLKYAETPWWQVAVIELNTFIDSQPETESKLKPVVISPMAPYLVDFYSNHSYTLLPLNEQQDFTGNTLEVWGVAKDANFHTLYQEKIDQGYPVYLASYGIGNQQSLHTSFDEVEKNFTLTKVHTGCYELCAIFQLSTKSAELK